MSAQIPARPLTRHLAPCASAALALLCIAAPATAADIQYPTEKDLRGFQTTCAGGTVKEAKGNFEGALKTWRLNPGAQINVAGAIRDLGAIIEKIKDGSDSRLYESYVDCVQTLILSYLQRANPAQPSQALQRAPDKPR
jgi:hypothetical protein